MEPYGRFYIMFSWFVGLGLDFRNDSYPLEISIRLPLFSIYLGIGKRK